MIPYMDLTLDDDDDERHGSIAQSDEIEFLSDLVRVDKGREDSEAQLIAPSEQDNDDDDESSESDQSIPPSSAAPIDHTPAESNVDSDDDESDNSIPEVDPDNQATVVRKRNYSASREVS